MNLRKLLALMLALLTLCACAQTTDPSPSVDPLPSATDKVKPTPESAPEGPSVPPATPAPGQYVFSEDSFPRMDGSTSLLPLGRAITSTLLGYTPEQAEAAVSFNRTSQSFRNLMYGQCDILISAEPAQSVWDECARENFQYERAHIATDALIFVVNEDNPVNSLTTEQIRQIYSGRITNWSQVGGDDVEIVPFQRNAEAGSQAAMERLVMVELEMMEPPTDYIVDSMSGLMEAVRGFDGSAGAIGYSVYYYANDMRMAEGLKIIAVDGVDPQPETIRKGQYPHLAQSYTVIAADTPEDAPARILFNWLQGADGQALMETLGYVSVEPMADAPDVYLYPRAETDPALETVGSRLREGPLPELEPASDYGLLLPYIGQLLYESSGYGVAGEKYGLVTAEGMVVTDPVYSSISRLRAYDSSGYATLYADFYDLCLTSEGTDGPEERHAITALDGSWVTEAEFVTTALCPLGALGVRSYDRLDVVCYEEDGSLVFDSRNWNTDGLSGYSWFNLTNLSEGLFAVRTDSDTYLFMDPAGRRYPVEGLEYTYGSFSNGLIAAQKDGKWGYLNTALEWVIEPIYDSAEPFNGDFALTYTNDHNDIVVIDRSGAERLRMEGCYGLYSAKAQCYLFSAFLSDENWYYTSRLEPVDLGGREANSEWWPASMEENGLWAVLQGELVYLEDAQNVTDCRDGIALAYLTDDGSAAYDLTGKLLLRSEMSLFLIRDAQTGETYIGEYAEDFLSVNVYDRSGTLLVTGARAGDAVNGLFHCVDSLSAGYKNTENQWVFRTRLQ